MPKRPPTPTKAQIKKQERDERRAFKIRINELAQPLPCRTRQKYDPDMMENGDGDGPQNVAKPNKPLSKRTRYFLARMAQPKYHRRKYQAPKWDANVKCTCMVTERPMSSRMQQMSLPLVRTLVPAKKALKPVLSKDHFKNIVTQLSKSLKTIYSKLYNIHSCKPATSKREKPQKRSAKKIDQWCTENSKPKQYESEEVHRLNQKTSLTSEDFDRLSTPRRIETPYVQRTPVKVSDPIVPIKKTALEFEPTPNIVALSQPKVMPEPTDFELYQNPYDVPREYRKIKTAGYQALSTPRNPRKRYIKGDNGPDTFEVSPNALKYKPSEMTTNLAKPKDDRGETPRPGFTVSKAALKKLKPDKEKYFATLATPKK